MFVYFVGTSITGTCIIMLCTFNFAFGYFPYFSALDTLAITTPYSESGTFDVWSELLQALTDFQNFFSDRLPGKFSVQYAPMTKISTSPSPELRCCTILSNLKIPKKLRFKNEPFVFSSFLPQILISRNKNFSIDTKN